ncbi:MAG: DUF624 domain-containing protein [Clostridiales bacterium]|nr:DUF624 domain-containing protein [Clostridiales bacterium]MDR2751373.1 DUF624 domain-containing protein [Clostridiales bacterium]
MGSFFSMDGPFYKVGSIVADIMLLSLYWFIFSIPIVTIGASTTAMYYVMTRKITNRDGYLFRDFFKGFKTNFKQATIIWLLALVVLAILTLNIMNIDLVGSMKTLVFPVQICFMIELALVLIYIFPIISRFEVKLKESFKFAFFMANRHLLTSLGCIVIAVLVLLAIYMYPLIFLVAIGIYVYLTSFLMIRVFKKYRPEIAEEEMIGEAILSPRAAETEIQINSQTLRDISEPGANGTENQ